MGTRANTITNAQRVRFFGLLRRAAANLGLSTRQEIEDYRHRVLMEEARVNSMRDLDRRSDYDACIVRLAADAGDYRAASCAGISDTRRKAYVVKVMAVQVMQLKGGGESESRDYIEGIVSQARVPCGVNTSDDSFWMDVSPRSLQNLLNILDTYRRKLIRANFPGYPVKFDDRVRYEVDGAIRIRHTGVAPDYYANIPFSVNVR